MTVVLTASSIFGTLFEAIRQPTLNGYLLAGSLIGPDGLALVKELVQVESLAQVQRLRLPTPPVAQQAHACLTVCQHSACGR